VALYKWLKWDSPFCKKSPYCLERATARDAMHKNMPRLKKIFFCFSFLGILFPTGLAAEWIELFDGKSLKGWQQRGGKANYRVEEGAIVGSSVPNTPNTFLCTKKDWGDFELELQFKVDPELNSGVQIRSNSLPKYHAGRVHGYQVEIDPSDRGWTGGIYDEGRRGWLAPLSENTAARYAFRPGEWNTFRVVAIGDSIKTFLNGTPAADLVDSKTAQGFIGLQVHSVGERSDPLEVRWRNIRLRPIEGVVPRGEKTRKVADGFRFTEGPAEAQDGRIFFSDIPNEKIHIFDPASGEVSVAVEDSGRANGLMFAPSGALLICEGGNRQLTRKLGDKKTMLADRFDGKRLNSPNDLVLDGKGGIYFTDPRYGDRSDMELQIEGVYYLPRGGELRRVIDDMVRPNGLIFSPDKSILYVADNGAKTVIAYRVQEDGSLEKIKKMAEMAVDGMAMDVLGNLYCTGGPRVVVFAPDGAQRVVIPVPEGTANCTFGGPDHKTLFITAHKGLYAIDLAVPGVLP
jgi:sugar lactone lactonase YvrE